MKLSSFLWVCLGYHHSFGIEASLVIRAKGIFDPIISTFPNAFCIKVDVFFESSYQRTQYSRSESSALFFEEWYIFQPLLRPSLIKSIIFPFHCEHYILRQHEHKCGKMNMLYLWNILGFAPNDEFNKNILFYVVFLNNFKKYFQMEKTKNKLIC